MDRTELLILILSALLLLRLVWDAVTVRQDRKALQHVVYVNGTRGKSTVTRMIAAGLTAGGQKLGPIANALAIPIRCLLPPSNSCG